MMRLVNPVPAPVVVVVMVSAAKISSLAEVVVAEPLLAEVPLPLAPTVTSSVLRPRYSSMRTSGYTAAWLNWTVTVSVPLATFEA